MEKFHIWSNEKQAWWGPAFTGYTAFVEDAGVYNREQMLTACAGSVGRWVHGKPPIDIPVPADDADALFARKARHARTAG
jgi:hypothetical protein